MAQRAFDARMAFSPQHPSQQQPTATAASMNNATTASAAAAALSKPGQQQWINEETAEEDPVLAVLSEGTEIYLRSVLEKALHCARQRQNVDGLRLWHQQQTYDSSSSSSSITETPTTTTTTTTSKKSGKDSIANRPPLSLRLGCDVARQVARAAGNAATICQRAEEALARQHHPTAEERSATAAVTPETLREASSLSEVALRPPLARAAADAAAEARRQFDAYGGGGGAVDPPFPLPPHARLTVPDFQTGAGLAGPPGRRRRRHRAVTHSGSFQY